MTVRKRAIAATIAMMGISHAGTAQAQWASFVPDMIALTFMNMNSGPNTCMTGSPVSDKELAEARLGASAAMQAYFAAASGAGGLKSAAFHTGRKTIWVSHGRRVALAGIDTETDPLAGSGNRLDTEPLRFYRSGNFSTAQGQWAVFDAAGKVIGAYSAVFERDRRLWKLRELTVVAADEKVRPATQYCVSPGDVDSYRQTSASDTLAYWGKELPKAEARLTEAEAKATAAEATLAAKPGNTALTALARDARVLAQRRMKTRDDARTAKENATKSHEAALADAARIEEATRPASEALALRGQKLGAQPPEPENNKGA